MDLLEFLDRAKALEQFTRDWKPSLKQKNDESPEETINRQAIERMLEALRQAILIYLFRRVYSVDPLMLQDNVQAICNLVCGTVAGRQNTVKYTAAFLWPVFIAASEALNPEVQTVFEQWFESGIKATSLEAYGRLLEVIQTVWRKRLDHQDNRGSWIEVLQEQNLKLFWC